MQRFIGHAIDVAGAALGDEPLHHRVHTGLPVRTPDAPTDGDTKIVTLKKTELTSNERPTETCACVFTWSDP